MPPAPNPQQKAGPPSQRFEARDPEEGLFVFSPSGRLIDLDDRARQLLREASAASLPRGSWRVWFDFDPEPGDEVPFTFKTIVRRATRSGRLLGAGTSLPVQVRITRFEKQVLFSVSNSVPSFDRLLTHLVDSIANGLILSDSDGLLVFANSQFLEMTGYASAEQAYGSSIWDLFESAEARAALAEPAGRWLGEVEMRKCDGSHFPARVHIRRMPDFPGMRGAIGTAIEDCTERRSAQERNRRDERKFTLLIDNSFDAVLLVDTQARILYANAAIYRGFGVTPQQIAGHSIVGPMVSPSASEFAQFFQTVLDRPGVPMQIRRQFLSDSRGHFWVEETYTNLIDDPAVAAIVLNSHEVTALVQIKEELRVKELALDSAINGFVISDAHGIPRYVNRALAGMYGYTPEEVVGHDPGLLGPDPEEAPRIMGALKRDGYFVGESTARRKDGSLFGVQLVCSVIRDPSGELVGMMGSVLDITERKQAEARIQRLTEELEHRVAQRTSELRLANRELEAFAYSVSHDLRAPLRAVSGFANILVEDFAPALNAEARRVIGVIDSEARRVGELIDALLEFSRLSRGSIRSTVLDMTALARAAFEEASTAELRDRTDFELADLPSATGDATMIRQVWVNLLANALKFSRTCQRIRIRIGGSTGTATVRFWVEDNGSGFDLAYSSKLFDVFHRLHSEEEFEGHGIGLALVQRIVTRHGGHVFATGAVDRGATFCFSLPRKDR